jgi:hypothetical integral membrane protein (TIGR02206 family)
MKRNKIVAIIGLALVAIMIVFVAFEASIVNTKENCFGEWKNGNALYVIKNDGTYSVNENGVVSEGTWEYSWYKLTLMKDGDAVTFKCKSKTLVADGLSLTKLEGKKLEPSTTAIFYSKGFFGYGEKGNFKYWSFAHFTPILVLALAIYLIYHYREALKNWKHEENFRFIFAAAMLFVEMSYFWRLLYVGSSEPGASIDMLDKLPLQVCEWTCILAVFMMMKKSRAIYPICFYVCLTIGVFPLLTPSVITTTGPAYYRYYQYWLEHMLPPIAVFYMTFVHGFRPTKKGIIPAVAFMSVLVVFALICNANIPGANYLYLADGTTDGGGSIMDPIRDMVGGSTVALLAVLAVAVLSIFFLAYYVHKWITQLSEKKGKNNETKSEA